MVGTVAASVVASCNPSSPVEIAIDFTLEV